MNPSPAALRSRLRAFDRALRLPGLLWVDSRATPSIPDDMFGPETDEERDARVLIEERRKGNARRRISYAHRPRRGPVEFDRGPTGRLIESRHSDAPHMWGKPMLRDFNVLVGHGDPAWTIREYCPRTLASEGSLERVLAYCLAVWEAEGGKAPTDS